MRESPGKQTAEWAI